MQMEIDGMTLAVSDTGRGQPLVLVHGNSLCGQSFDGLFDSEHLSCCRLIAPDLPGHGASGAAASSEIYSVPGYAKVIARLLDELDLQRAVMVGHSLGGHAVIEMMQSPRVAAALVFGAPPLASPADVPKAFLPHPAMAAAFQAEASDDEIAALAEALAGAGKARALGWIRETRPEVRAGLGASMQQGAFADEVAIVAAYDRPVAFLHGERDPLVSRSYIEGLAMPTLWCGAVQTVPAAGHSPQLEQPDALAALLAAFVEEVAS